MSDSQDQIFESYLPEYSTVPEKWEEGRQFLVEQLKKIATAVNIREIGWYLDQELLSGKQFIPGVNNSQEYRSIFRKVISFSPIVIGANSVAHGITFDANFTLIDLFVSGTNSAGFVAATYTAPEVNINATNITFTSPVAYDRGFAIVEYIQEL